MRKIIVAIDGPAGSGKTSSAKLLAEKLNYVYIDTGAMYRAVTLAWLKNQVNLSDKLDLSDEALQKVMNENTIELKSSPTGQITLLNGIDVSNEIRSAEVNKFVSPISANELVRTKLVEWQRELGKNKCCVMDGRDIGTTVFPNAELKIFLVATIGARAKRRLMEYEQKGITNLSFDEIAEQIIARDKYDSNREISPLRKAEDAVEINTSDMTLEGQVEHIYKIATNVINS
jgi:cytidylate kinase